MNSVIFASVFIISVFLLLSFQRVVSWFRFFVAVSATTLLFMTTATALVILGLYSLGAVLFCVLMTMMILVVAARFFFHRQFSSPRALAVRLWKLSKKEVLLISAFLLIFLVLNILFPINSFQGGRDYGLYEIHAIHISRTGGMRYLGDAFLTENHDALEKLIQPGYMGIFDATASGLSGNFGDLDPQFLPFFPAALAMGYDLFQMTGLLAVNSIINFFSLLAFYVLARKVLGRKAAILALLFLSFCPAQIWGARVTQSEQVAQWLFLLTSLCFYKGWKERKSWWMYGAAFLLGIGNFNRLDNYILYLPVYAMAVYSILWCRDLKKTMMLTSLLMTVGGVFSFSYLYTFHRYYFTEHWEIKGLDLLILGCATMILVVLVCAIVFWRRDKGWTSPISVMQKSKKVRTCIVGILFLCALTAMVVLPWLFPESFEANSLREFSWYMSPLAVFLALVGVWGFLSIKNLGDKVEPVFFFLLSGITSTVLYTLNPSVARDHFWASRRWVPVNFPFIFFLAGVGIVLLSRYLSKKWMEKISKQKCVVERPNTSETVTGDDFPAKKKSERRKKIFCMVITLVLSGTMICYMIARSELFLFRPFLLELNEQYEELTELLPDDTLILMDIHDPGPLGMSGYASVLRFAYDKPVYLLREEMNAKELFNALAVYFERQESVYYVGQPSKFFFLTGMELMGEVEVGGLFPFPAQGSYPDDLVSVAKNLQVWRFSPSDAVKSQDVFGLLHHLENVKQTEAGLEIEGSGILFYGPYLSLPAGRYTLEGELEASQISANLLLRVLDDKIYAEIPEITSEKFSISFTLTESVSFLEFVMTNHTDEPLIGKSLVLLLDELFV